MAIEKPILHQPTPLHGWTAEQSRTNAWTHWFGFSTASVYGDVVEEQAALASGAGIADFTPYPTYELKGARAAAYLDRLVTRPASAMAVGEVREVLMCAASGHVISLCTLLRLEEARFLLMTASEVGMRLGEGREATSIVVARSALVPIALIGPARAEMLSELGVNQELDEDGFVSSLEHKGIPLVVADLPARTAAAGGGSFVFARAEDAGLMWERLMRQGQALGRDEQLLPVGLNALQRRRIDLGIPQDGLEFRSAPLALKASKKALPEEIGLGHLVEQDGRVFSGAAALNATTGTRRLVRLELDRVASILDDPVMAKGRKVGRVSSTYQAPELGLTKALALVDKDAGDDLSVGFDGDAVSTFVVSG